MLVIEMFFFFFLGDRGLSFPVVALFSYPIAIFVKLLCGVLYDARLWMAECIGIIWYLFKLF